jgi:hypothetical protein
MNHHHTPDVGARFIEAQDYQAIGELAPSAEQVLTNQKVWDGLNGDPPTPVQPIAQYQAQDISFWNRRADIQALGSPTPGGNPDANFAADFFAPNGTLRSGAIGAGAGIPPTAGYALGQGYTQTPTAATDPIPFDQFDSGVIQGATAADEQSGNAGFVDHIGRS